MRPFRFLSHEATIIFLLISFSLFLGLFPTLYRQSQTPQDRIFAGTEFYSDDYSAYISYIMQGKQRRNTIIDKHTPEPQNGTLMHEEYLVIGKLAAIFNLHQVTAYHLARFLLGFAYLLVVWYFLLNFFPQDKKIRLLSFFLFITAASFPIFNNNPFLQSKWHFSWFMEFEPIYRSTMLPHYILGATFFLLTLTFLTKYLFKSPIRKKYLVFALIAGNLLAFLHPANLIILDSIIALTIVFKVLFIKTNRLLYLVRYLAPFLLFIVGTLPIIVLFQIQMSAFPWNFAMKAWENSSDFPPTLTNLQEYFLGLGPVSFAALIGLIFILLKLICPTICNLNQKNEPNDFTGRLTNFFIIFSWIITYFLLLFSLSRLIHISQIRFMNNPVLIPIAILGTIGLLNLSKLLAHLLSKTFSPKFQNPILLVFCLVFIIITLPTYYYQVRSKIQFYADFSTLIYPTKEEAKSFDWLLNKTKPEDAVIAAYEVSSLLPIMSGNTVYAGHLWSTVNYEEKSKKQGVFFSGQMPENEAREFLHDNNIKYVYYGFQEQSGGGNLEKYPFLKEVYNYGQITIFKVN